MARVTVEDCTQVINNRYELVLLAAQRARDISAGALLTLDRDNDKNTVVALREIAEQSINLDEIRRHIARGVNRQSDNSAEDEALLALAGSAFGAGSGTATSTASAEASDIEEVAFEEIKEEVIIEASAEEVATNTSDVVDENSSDEDILAALQAMTDLPDAEEVVVEENAIEENAKVTSA